MAAINYTRALVTQLRYKWRSRPLVYARVSWGMKCAWGGGVVFSKQLGYCTMINNGFRDNWLYKTMVTAILGLCIVHCEICDTRYVSEGNPPTTIFYLLYLCI